MKKRIFQSMLMVALTVILATLTILSGVLYHYFENREIDRLAAQLRTLRGDRGELEALTKIWEASGYRITCIDVDGKVSYDNNVDPETMENHRDREEFLEAVKLGNGESHRFSHTLSQKTIYVARRMEDGTVWRLAVDQKSITALMVNMLQPVAIVLIISGIFCGFIARSLSRRIMIPLQELDLDHPLWNQTYEELSPILQRISNQQQQMRRQLEDLNKERESFDHITNNLTEGLVLLDGKGKIVSLNQAAMGLFGTDGHALGQDLITMERSMDVVKVVENALEGAGGECLLEKDGRHYQMRATPVMEEGIVTGVCLLTFDISERLEAEMRRREFSANVSHELKTPLHTIMGSAELMANNLVKEEDVPLFMERIRKESTRLLELIDQMMNLSKLDEKAKMPIEEIDLMDIAKSVVHRLTPMAQQKQVNLEVKGGSVLIQGVKLWLETMVFNLVDNAIKYNQPHGTVKITISEKAEQARFEVEDTGIGIPKSDSHRIFERFYRVDKSHGRDTGGTGLGLAMVKRAVVYHHGEVQLVSEEDKGTTIVITLPKTYE